jgi:hypothetical protein
MSNDDKIKTLLDTIKKQREELGAKPKASWETNGIFKFSGSDHFNLNTVTDPEVLVRALAFLLEKQITTSEAAKRLGVESSGLKWEGYAIGQYEEDFKQRLEIIQWDAKKKLLQKTEKKLKSLVSEEARTEMELKDIEALLGE